MITKLSDVTIRSTVYVLFIIGVMGILGGCAAQQEPVSESPEADQPAQAEQPVEETEEDEMEETEATAQAEESETEEAQAPARPGMSDAVRSYVRMASEGYVQPDGDAKYDHVYTASRFRSLASALESAASAWNLSDADRQQIGNHAATLRQSASKIQEKRIAPHSKDILNGLEAGAEALNYLSGQQAALGSIHAELADEADSFDPEVVFLDQTSTVEGYFKKSARFFETLYQ